MDKDKYLKHYRIGFKKYLPTFMIPKFKPKIIDTIKIEDKVIGEIAGINLKDIDFKTQADIDEYLKSIKNILDSNIGNLYIEGQEDMSEDLIRYIEEKLNLKIENGYSNKIQHLPYMIKNIFKFLKENPSEKEILIIGDDLNMIKNVAVKISSKFKFISIYGMSEDNKDDVYEYILENTGASIFFPTDLNKVIKSYDVIINLADSIFNESCYRKTKRSTIVFDFSNTNKQFNTIHDFDYKIQKLNPKQSIYFDKGINSSLCQGFKNVVGEDLISPENIISRGEVYGIQEYIKLFIRLKGKF